jgi:hypothetical protein
LTQGDNWAIVVGIVVAVAAIAGLIVRHSCFCHHSFENILPSGLIATLLRMKWRRMGRRKRKMPMRTRRRD